MEHWDKVDMTTANRIEEEKKNEETFPFKPEVHSAPNHSRGNGHPTSDIYSRLYRDGTQWLREKEEKSLKREKTKDEIALEKCTFRPAINTRSLELIRRRRLADHSSRDKMGGSGNGGYSNSETKTITGERTNDENKEGIFEVLYDPPRFTDKVVNLARQQEEKEMAECTFQPKISARSRKIVSRKRKLN